MKWEAEYNMNKKDRRIISQIQSEANMKFDDELFMNRPVGDHIKDMIAQINRITEDGWQPFLDAHPDISTEDVEKLKDKLKTGEMARMFEGEERVVDEKVAKKKDKWVEKQVEKAIKEGRLSDPKKDILIKKIKRNLKRHERSNKESKNTSNK